MARKKVEYLLFRFRQDLFRNPHEPIAGGVNLSARIASVEFEHLDYAIEPRRWRSVILPAMNHPNSLKAS